MDTHYSMPIIIIIGLRRSGTTAFWKAFREDSRLCCYDEPFNPNLKELPEENSKGTRKAFIDLYKTAPDSFNRLFSPISYSEETKPTITNMQEVYLRWLLAQAQGREAIVIDSVRLNFKLAKIHSCFPNTILVHLYRQPKAWISSHMLPSGKRTWRKPLANIYRKMSFWTRQGYYNNWGYQEIIEREIAHHSHWDTTGTNAINLKEKPAVVKLAAFWQWAYNEAESRGQQFWGDRFFSISFEDFCAHPGLTLAKIYKTAELEMPALDYSYIRPANRGFMSEHKRWNSVLKAISSEQSRSK